MRRDRPAPYGSSEGISMVMAPRHPGAAPARVAAAGWGTAALCYLASEGAAALAFRPSYSYARNYISDLGLPACGAVFEGRAVCSPLHALMNADFVLQGVLFAVAAFAAARLVAHKARFALFAAAVVNGIGIALVGLYPENTPVPGIHGLGAFLAIVAGNATALISAFALRELGLPRVHRLASLALPLLAAAALAMLFSARAQGKSVGLPDGIWERTSVYTITVWELVTAGCLAAWASTRLRA